MKPFFDYISKEPIAMSEAVRQTVLMLVAFQVLNVTEIQLTALLSAMGAMLALFSRSQSTPNIKVDEHTTTKPTGFELPK